MFNFPLGKDRTDMRRHCRLGRLARIPARLGFITNAARPLQNKVFL
ncbi:hypothetical protein [Desulfovibrio desulfuricans]|nr:hypothetical protein [Desulfovibrio desulfuricans]MDD3682850.1 hypothetical protein [Desulfovibrio desulfuricans]QTO40986.1 hypothetical protein J8J02_03450 [Desulfovibrio desulfuricans]